MNCYKCATPLPDNSRFCNSCGADVSGAGHDHDKTLALDADPELMKKLQADVGTEYVIEKELGRGGMAIVFLGHDAHLGRKVAVKLLPPELTYAAGTSVIERFKREARTSATLDHPNVIPVYRVSQGQKLFWYVMKFLEGESLDTILEREGQLPVERTAEILRQTADALDYAHANQVIHRDIKPANLMIDAKGRVTVTDFGIAKALDANTLTATGSMIGTPYYMSPEQCAGKRVGPASDQYALGVMAYQMLGGHLPFTGDSVIDIIRKHCMDPVPPLAVLRPNLPPQLVAVVERALAKTPEERFQNATEFARAFAAAAQGLSVTVAPPAAPGFSRPRMSKTALVSPIPGALRSAKGSMISRRNVLIAGSVVLVAGVAAAIVVWPRFARVRALPIATADSSTRPPAPATQGVAVADSANRDSAGQVAASDTNPLVAAIPASPPAASPSAAQPARLTLRGVPAGATVTRDGARIRGNAMDLDPGRRHIVSVTAAGFEPWLDTLRPAAGQRLTRTVTLRAATAAVPPRVAQPAAQPALQPAAQPAAPPAALPAAAAPTTGYISVLTNPRSTIYIGTTPTNRYPLSNYPVPAGTVTLRFQVADSTGLWWARDRVIQVRGGDTVRVGVVRLERP